MSHEAANPQNAHAQLEALTSDLNRDFVRNDTLNRVSAVLRRQTRLNRRYARRQIRSYEAWVRLSHKKLRAHRRTQRILSRVGIHNEWLRERLERLKSEQNERKLELQARRALILRGLQRRADAEHRRVLQIEQRSKADLQELANRLEEDLCSALDEVGRLQTNLDEMKTFQLQALRSMSRDSECAIDRTQRAYAFELKERLLEVRDLHVGCHARQAEADQRLQEAVQRLRNILGETKQTGSEQREEVPPIDEQESIIIDDSDEDDEWSRGAQI